MKKDNELKKTIEDYEKEYKDLDPKEKDKLLNFLDKLQRLFNIN